MRSIRVALLATGAALAAMAAGSADANAKWHPSSYEPPHGRAFHGVSGTVGKERDFQRFRHWVGAHPAVLQAFFPWGTSLTHGALPLWQRTSTRGMLSLGTSIGGREIIRPGQISRGRGDGYIVKLNRSIASHRRQVVYIRLMPEMNGSWNPYSAYNADGSARGHGHSTKSFRRAWRRFTIIIRGGSVARINHRLRGMKMPPLHASGVGRRLPHPKVAMVWNPQTIGSPAVSGNSPRRYWPGRRYVDWVGADIYSKFASPGIRAALSRFYASYRGLPFEIGEYSPWDADPGGRFTKWLFRWSAQRGRARMLVYYRSVYGGGPYDINHYGAARRALRHILNQRRWISYPPGTRHRRRR